MRASRAISVLLAAALAAGSAIPATAAGDDLDARSRALLALRVLAYDSNIKQRAGSAVTIGILFRPGDRASEERRDVLRQAFEDVAHDVVVAGLPVRVEVLPYRDATSLDARLEGIRPALVYVDQALAHAVAEIVQVTRRRGVLTAEGSKSMVEAGIAIGIVLRGDRAGVIVGLSSARHEGAELDPALLAVAEVIRD